MAPPYSHLPPTPCHHELILIFSLLPYFSGRKHLLCPLFFRTVNHPDIWERHPQMERWVGDNIPGLASLHSPTKSSSPTLGCISGWVFVFLRARNQARAQGNPGQSCSRAVCVWDCRDGWDLDKGHTLVPSAHCSALQPMSPVPQGLMMIVTVLPGMKLRRET